MEKCSGAAKDRRDADTIAALRGKLFNKRFVLRTTGACDVYIVYGCVANAVQTVDMLPLEKYDLFIALTDILRQMTLTIQQSNCPGCQVQSKSDCGATKDIDTEEITEEAMNIDAQEEAQGVKSTSKDQEASAAYDDKHSDGKDSDDEGDEEAETEEAAYEDDSFDSINELLA